MSQEPQRDPGPVQVDVSAMDVLTGVKAGENPTKPVPWTSPEGVVVLHGDLFGDGRHLAVLGAGPTTLAVASKQGWKVLAEWKDVAPTWVPAGKKAEDYYYRIDFPKVPFILKDVTGDKVPEILISFNNDGWDVGYWILKKKGEGAELLEIRSEDGEPEFKAGYMVVCTSGSGRKYWGSMHTCYRWEGGRPVEVASFGDVVKSDDSYYLVAVRNSKDGSDQTFNYKVDSETGVGVVRLSGRDSDEAFATLRVQAPEPGLYVNLSREDLYFEKLTGIPGEVRLEPKQMADYRKMKAGAKWTVIEGTPEANALLGEKKAEAKKPHAKQKR